MTTFLQGDDDLKEIKEKKYCEECGKETLHIIQEDALEIEYICTKCDHSESIIKTMF